MKSDLLATSPLVDLALVALFLAVFVGALVHTLGRKRGAFDGVASLPLADEGDR